MPAQTAPKRNASPLYRRIQIKLDVNRLYDDHDLANLVQTGLHTDALDSLTAHGIASEEIYNLILPRRTLVHRKARAEKLTLEESDRAVRLARITALAEEVFGEDERAARWLRKPKARFHDKTPMAMLQSDAGARLVEEMLVQLDHGMVA